MAIENASRLISEKKYTNIILANDNFKNLSKIVQKIFPTGGLPLFNGIVFDLGLSGAQLEDRDRGFSFREDAPLDMSFAGKRIGAETETQAIVNGWREEDLYRIIKEYGEERFARRIAGKIAEYRKSAPITTTGQLVGIILSAMPDRFRHGPIHPATRTFQALRIATNGELENIEEALPQALELLKPGGRIAVASFHSLEDRIVKRFFKKESIDCHCPPSAPQCVCGHKAGLKIITKKPVEPTEDEIRDNPKSRSAKLRVAEKI
jgi:16S rRNA (cytosine1402-N4)-methyltransferase